MKNIFLLTFIFILTGFIPSHATNPISVEAFTESINAHDVDNQNQKWHVKVFSKVKRFFKEKNPKVLKNLGITALAVGLLSLVALFSLSLIGPSAITIAFLLAIAGDILSIITLIRTARTGGEFRKVRIMAWIGLIASLLTGLLPLVLFILILISIQ